MDENIEELTQEITENEDTSDNSDVSSIVKEIQILNQGISANGERLDKINELLTEQNDNAKLADEIIEPDESDNEEVEEETEQVDQYEVVLQSINDQIVLNNQLLAGSFIFYGIICGILLFKILWDKLK